MRYYLTAGGNIRSIMIETKNDVKLKQFNVYKYFSKMTKNEQQVLVSRHLGAAGTLHNS